MLVRMISIQTECTATDKRSVAPSSPVQTCIVNEELLQNGNLNLPHAGRQRTQAGLQRLPDTCEFGMTSFWYRGKIMTTETSQPARPHVNPILALSAHDTGWKLPSAGFSCRLVLVPGCVTKSRLFKLASYRIEPSGVGGRGSIVVTRQCVAQSSLLGGLSLAVSTLSNPGAARPAGGSRRIAGL